MIYDVKNLKITKDGDTYNIDIAEEPSVMTGATSSTAGTSGLVPAPAAGDNGKFLKGDGSWDDVPDPQAMTGATSSTAGTSGLVPAPAAGDQDKVLTGAGTWITPPDVSGKADKVSGATTGNFAGLDSNGNLTDSGHKPDDYLEQTYHFVENDTFEKKLWVGFAQFYGNAIWTDGANIYYSYSSNQYVLDESTSTWDTKTWTGLTSFSGIDVWTDGNNIYYSSYVNQKVLDKSTSSWSNKTWTGLTSFLGEEVWSDNTNIYYSFGEDHYILNKSTSTWSEKEWTGLTDFNGEDIWTDGENIYYSSGAMQYVLDKSTSTWSEKVWTGLTSFSGIDVWTDGNNIYYSNYSNQYVLDTLSSTWSTKNWAGINGFAGAYIWNDGNDIYYSDGSKQYVLVLGDPSNQILLGVTGEWTRTSLNNFKNLIPMSGATASSAGSSGLVPAPAAGDQNKVLTGAGAWGNVQSVILMPSSAFSIPASGSSVTYNMDGITANHQLVRWNFSSSAENNPPVSLEWTTSAGSFTITNSAGTTSETIQPVFAEITGTTITANNS